MYVDLPRRPLLRREYCPLQATGLNWPCLIIYLQARLRGRDVDSSGEKWIP